MKRKSEKLFWTCDWDGIQKNSMNKNASIKLKVYSMDKNRRIQMFLLFIQVCLYYPIVMFNAYFWVKVVCLGILLNERRMQHARHASQFATRASQRCLGDYLMDVLGYVWWISQLQMVFFWKKTPKTMLTKSLSCVEWALGELKSMRWKPEIIHLEIHDLQNTTKTFTWTILNDITKW